MLELQLSQVQAANRHGRQKQFDAFRIETLTSEKAALLEANKQLKNENVELKDELEELRAMIEILKGQLPGRQGLISEPRTSLVEVG